MKKQKNTPILYYLFLIDRSGSMSAVREQTVKNINEQIKTLKESAKNERLLTKLTIMLFDSLAENRFDYLVCNKDINKVPLIEYESYVPDGGTPLRDAIGYSVTRLQKNLNNILENENVKVLVTIFTDGQENSSRSWSHEQIQKMIKQLSEDGKFIFTFVGAGGIVEVKQYASSIGISESNTCAYVNSSIGNNEAFKNLRMATTNFVSGYASHKNVSLDFFAKVE
jgi:uncharacterized protein with von Willebrand factor type A (vWA) domain